MLVFQIFTNADKEHAAQVLSRLGLEDCFEGIICFETLNPPHEPVDCVDAPEDTLNPPHEPIDCMDVPEDTGALAGDAPETTANGLTDGRSFSSKLRVLCKPSVEAIEAAIQIANIDPKKTVIFKAPFFFFYSGF